MDEVLLHTQRLLQKLQLLQRQLEIQTKDQLKLKLQLQQNELELAGVNAQLKTVLQQNAILKTGANQMPATERKAFERKINQYVKDLEKAIAQLSA